MASYPIDRARNLLNGTRPAQSTPRTLTGDADGNVKSYALTIAEHITKYVTVDIFKVHPRNQSRTTNRHIDAVGMALSAMGYKVAHTDDDGYAIWAWPHVEVPS